jgi:Sec-independent protein translocase protein TatA
MKKILATLLIALLGFSLSSCAWVGRTAGKAKAKVERNVGDMDRAYEQGYTDEKRKTKKTVQPSDATKNTDKQPTQPVEGEQSQPDDVVPTSSI